MEFGRDYISFCEIPSFNDSGFITTPTSLPLLRMSVTHSKTLGCDSGSPIPEKVIRLPSLISLSEAILNTSSDIIPSGLMMPSRGHMRQSLSHWLVSSMSTDTNDQSEGILFCLPDRFQPRGTEAFIRFQVMTFTPLVP